MRAGDEVREGYAHSLVAGVSEYLSLWDSPSVEKEERLMGADLVLGGVSAMAELELAIAPFIQSSDPDETLAVPSDVFENLVGVCFQYLE
jgi:hypothetical protein